MTAIALAPLTVWFVATIIARSGSHHLSFISWLRSPLTASLMVMLLIVLFCHSALGLEVVIEDDIYSGVRFAAVIAVRLGCFAFAVLGVLAVLRVAIGR